MADGLQLTLAFGLPFCIALVFVPLAARCARRMGYLDHPVGYKKHLLATPYLGGAAVMAAALPVGLLFSGGAFSFTVIVLCVIGLSVVGTIDDRIGLPPRVRVLVEVGAALALWNAGLAFHASQMSGLNLGLTILWVVGLVNAFNLMDNLDGAAGTVGSVSAAGAAVACVINGDMALASLALALSGACAGFLPFNLARPSRIFLGDGGSMPIGFLVGAILMANSPSADPGYVAILALVPFVGLPVLDTTLVVVSRTRRGVSVFSGGRDHLTHRLLPPLGNPRAVAVALGLMQVSLCLVGLALFQASISTVLITAGVYMALGASAIRVLDGSPVFARGFAPPVSRDHQSHRHRPLAAAPSQSQTGGLEAGP